MKKLFISEKPSVAQEFAKALKYDFKRRDGFLESEEAIVTWCVGHLVTMSYPEAYDPALKRWRVETLPFLPKEYKYEIIPAVEKQFNIVKSLLLRDDVQCIYVCTDSGREGEYIYRLVDQMAGVPAEKEKRRVWIDSQTEEEIHRGIKEAKLLSEYDALASSAYLRAQEDYLMGINFSRILTLKYGDTVKNFLRAEKNQPISVGRVMTCVLGMVVRREREIRSFVKTPFYRVVANINQPGSNGTFEAEFRAVEGSKYFNTPALYKENGFKEKETAEKLIASLLLKGKVFSCEKKKENKNPPLLYNLAELQNDCSRMFKISPDDTLKYTQELYEKKLVTYPRTDARVLSTAVAKEIHKNIGGLRNYQKYSQFAAEIIEMKSYQGIAKTRYVNDKQITDHYAIIPTGQGFNNLGSLSPTARGVYDAIVRRFLSIFYPAAVYRKVALVVEVPYKEQPGDKTDNADVSDVAGTDEIAGANDGGNKEKFFANFKVLMEPGYLKVAGIPQKQGNGNGTASVDAGQKDNDTAGEGSPGDGNQKGEEEEVSLAADALEALTKLRKGSELNIADYAIKLGETAPPKRYNSGSLILAMENAGQFIEDEELRAQIKGSGIGTSATRAEILNKLVKIAYLNLNSKTQIVTPSLMGELVFEVVQTSIKSLLNAELTASWEKGLTYVAEGTITPEEYRQKLENFVTRMTNGVKGLNNQGMLYTCFNEAAKNYKKV